jgi:hypothetical protein
MDGTPAGWLRLIGFPPGRSRPVPLCFGPVNWADHDPNLTPEHKTTRVLHLAKNGICRNFAAKDTHSPNRIHT